MSVKRAGMQNAAAMKAAPMPCRPASNAAVEEGRISRSRLESYLGLQGELAKTARRRKQSTWKRR